MPGFEQEQTGATTSNGSQLNMGVVGFSGLKQYGGTIDEEFHPKLRGTRGPKLYREMADNSSAVGAILYVMKSLVRQVDWRAEPADDSEQAAEWADFLESCVIDMSGTFEDFISEVLSMLPYGFSYFETVYKLRKGKTADSTTRSQFNDGRIGWRKFSSRPQDTLDHWEFDPQDGGLRGMVQADPTTGKTAFIPIEKSILFRTETTKNNPEGRSLFRNAVVDYFFLKRISEIEAIGIERDMTGLVCMQVPVKMLSNAADANDLRVLGDLETMLGQLKRDERDFAIIPSETDANGKPTGYKFSLLSTGGQRQINTTAVKDYYKVNILQSVLAQFIQLGVSNVGSFALASSQTNLFAVALGAILNNIASTFNRFGVSRLMELNGVPQELWPTWVHGDIESPPLGEIGAYITALAAAGQLPEDPALTRRLVEIAGLPIPDMDNLTPTRGPGQEGVQAPQGAAQIQKCMHLHRARVPAAKAPLKAVQLSLGI